MALNTFAPGQRISSALVNENFTYLQSIFGSGVNRHFDQNDSTTAGLTWGWLGGVTRDSAGAIHIVAAGTIALTGNATNRVELDPATGTVSVQTTGAWTASKIPLRLLVTSDFAITANTDVRAWCVLGGAGGSAATTAALGSVKMSVAPVDATAPIAVGDNDPRLPSQNFTEAVQDVIGAFFVAGTGITLNYNDATNSFTVTNSAPLDVEAVQDVVGAMVASGSNVTATYNDAAGTLTISSAGSSTLTTEDVQDIVAGLLQAGTNVTLSYNDASNTLTVTAAGSGSADGAGYLNRDVSGGSDITLTDLEASALNLRFYGTLTANINIYFPDKTRFWNIDSAIANNGFSITFRTVGSGGFGTDTGVGLTSGLTTQVNHIQGAFTQQLFTGGTSFDVRDAWLFS